MLALTAVLLAVLAAGCGRGGSATPAAPPPASAAQPSRGLPRGVNPFMSIQVDGVRVCALGEDGKQLARPTDAVRVAETKGGNGSFELTLLRAPSWDKSILAYFIFDAQRLSVCSSQVGHPFGGEAGQLALAITTRPGVAAVGIVPIRGKVQEPSDATDWAAKVMFARTPEAGKSVAVAPTGLANKVTDLSATANGNLSVSLTWTEVNVGDYDSSGEVNIADLQPVAAYYMATPTGPNDPAYMADGDLSGEVNIGDLQPIANDFMDLVTGCNVYRVSYVPPAIPDFSTPGAPLPNHAPSPINTSISVDRTANPPAHPHLTYEYLDSALISGDYAYIVRPYSTATDSPPEGTVSNYATAHVASLPVPDTTPPVWQDGNVGILYTTHDATSVTVYFWKAVDALSPPVKYNIYWAQGVKTNFADLGAAKAPGVLENESEPLPHSYQVAGLTPGTVYTFGVRAEDSATPPPNEDTNTNMVSDAPGLDSGWPFFHLDQARTGTGTENIYPPLTSVWSQMYGISTGITSNSPVIYGNQCILGSNNGDIISFDSATGALLWSYPTGHLIAGTPAVSNGRVFVGNSATSNSRIYCVDAYSGAFLWWYNVGDDILGAPVVAGDTVYFGSQDKNVYALDVRDASLKWQFTADAPVSAGPSLANGVIYVGSTSGNFYALDALSGGQLWTFTAGGSITGSASISAGNVLVPCQDGKVYCLDTSGNLVWAFTTGGAVVSTPAIVSATAYFGSMGQKVYAVDVATGVEKWHFSAVGRFASSPAVTPNGILFIGGDDNKLYALDASTGVPVTTPILVGNHVYSSPAVFNHQVYFASADATVYCYAPVSDAVPPTWNSTVGITDAIGGDSQVTVRWGHATDAERAQVTYNIYYSTDPAIDLANPGGTPATTVRIGNVPDNGVPAENSYTVTGLANGTRYYFAVRCQDGHRTADVAEPQPNEDTNTNILGATPPWLLTRIPVGGIPVKCSFAFDSTSTPHVSYTVKDVGLFHAVESGATFQVEAVPADPSGFPFENDIDTHDDVPYIAYNLTPDSSGAGAFDLHEIDKQGGVWTDHPIDQLHQTGRMVSLGISSNGWLNIATPYVITPLPDQTFQPYAYSNLLGGWTAWDVDPTDLYGGYVSMAPVSPSSVQDQNYPAMAYNFSTQQIFSTTNGIYGQLKYAEWNGMSWVVVPVDNTPSDDVGKNCSLAWTPDGRPGILYLNLSPPQYLKYAVRNAVGNWQTFPIVPIHPSYEYLHQMTSLAYDQAGFYGMAYWDEDSRGKTPMFLGSHTGLALEVIDEVALNPAYDASIKVHFTSAGLPAVVYCDVSNAAVVYALRLVPPT